MNRGFFLAATLLATPCLAKEPQPPDLNSRLRSVMEAGSSEAEISAAVDARARNPDSPNEEELPEVTVTGEEPRGRRSITAWLKRVPGTYRIEGTLSLRSGLSVPAK